MTLPEPLELGIEGLLRHPLRSVLTMLGMVFGVAAVIAMLAIGAGAQRQALELIERLGLHTVTVRDVPLPDEELEKVRKDSPGLSPRDVEAILDSVSGTVAALPQVGVRPYLVLGGGHIAEASVEGVSWRLAELTHLEVRSGRYLDPMDERERAAVCVLGQRVRRRLFGFEPALRRRVKVNDLWLEVVGVLAPSGGASVGGVTVGSADDRIHIPYTTAMEALDHPPLAAPLEAVTVELDSSASGIRVAGEIRSLLRRLHGTDRDFELVVPEALLEQSRRTRRLFSLVMGCIAGISLLVGGIGIMNIMLASVLERTREIGVRRAVGATRRDILELFLAEAFTISVLGGLAGIVLGVILASIIARLAGWATVVTPLSVLLATGVAMAVGIVSGLAPARRAANLDPIEALRYE
jgi:putative ABC transport system permease protein